MNAGDIRGIVTDSTGAAVPGVTVSVVNKNTGVEKELITNQDGLYDTSSIVAGSYEITFSKAGFSKLVRSNITVEVREHHGQRAVERWCGVRASDREYRRPSARNREWRAEHYDDSRDIATASRGRAGLAELHDPDTRIGRARLAVRRAQQILSKLPPSMETCRSAQFLRTALL